MAKHNLKINFREYFTLSNGERKGTIILIVLIGLAILAKFTIQHRTPVQTKINTAQFEKEISLFEKATDSLKIVENSKKSSYSPRISFKEHDTFSQKTKSKIEINTADSATLEKLPGIGKILSSRIVKYRNKLGGFYSLDQLNEIYNLKPETIKVIRQYLRTDTSKIQKLPLNTATFKEINAHPYLSFDQTRQIFKIRNRTKISSLDQLVNASILTTNEMTKIRPYLSFK